MRLRLPEALPWPTGACSVPLCSAYLRWGAFWGPFHFLLPERGTTPGVNYLKVLRQARKLQQVGSCACRKPNLASREARAAPPTPRA